MEENKYKDVLKGIIEIIRNAEHSDIGFASICTYIGDHCPELGESEDEQTRKQLLDLVHRYTLAPYSDRHRWVAYLEKLKDFDKQLEQAYKNSDEVQYNRGYRAAMEEMEKQDKQTADCPQNHQDVNHPNGCITMEDFSGGEGFYKLNIEYLNKRQVEEIEETVRTWNKGTDCELCTSKDHCISIEEQEKIKDGNSIDPHFGKPITITKMVNDFANGELQPSLLEIDAYRRGISDILEKQGEQSKEVTYTHEVETGNGNIKALVTEKVQLPKFKVGDFIVNDYCMGRVAEITNDAYLLDTGQGIPFSCEHNAHLWSISDAKDGDVLYSPCCKLLWIYKDEKTCYVGSNLNYNSGSIVINKSVCIPTDVIPATKEQRELLFQKIKEAGYEWNPATKLSHKEVTMKSDKDSKLSEEDEDVIYALETILDILIDPEACIGLDEVQGVKNETMKSWLKSIKDRIQPKPKQVGWSEEDEENLHLVLECFTVGQLGVAYCKVSDWLDSIKQRLS